VRAAILCVLAHCDFFLKQALNWVKVASATINKANGVTLRQIAIAGLRASTAVVLLACAPAVHAQTAPEDLENLPPLEPIAEGELPTDETVQTDADALPSAAEPWEVEWPELEGDLPPLAELPPVLVDAQEPPLFPPGEGSEQLADNAGYAPPAEEGELVAAGDSAQPAFVPFAEELGYSVALEGFGGIADALFAQRFDGLSVLRAGDDDPANGAQINRRIAEDSLLLERMLRNEGYYDATLTNEVRRDGNRVLIVFVVQPGPRYTYSSVTLAGLDAAGADESARLAPFYASPPGDPIAAGDPIIADAIIAAQASLQAVMRDTGYPFAESGEELVTVDHDIRRGTLEQDVDPGPRLRFGSVIADDGGLLGARHIQRIARFRPGEWYSASEVEDLRRALIATGLVASVEIEPQANDDGQTVDVGVSLAPAPPRTIAGLVGYSSGQGFRAEVSWEHRNLFPPEGALILRGIAGTREQLASITYRRNNFMRRDRVLTVQALASNIDSDAFEARTIFLQGRLERATTLIFQKVWSWAIGAEIIGTDELAFVPARNADLRQRYVIGGVSGLLSWDRSDDLLDPTRGFRLTGRVMPEVSFNNGTFAYVRTQFDATGYLPLGDRAVLAGRFRLGAIAGAARDDIAPSRRFYAGGGGSVRGYGFQAIGPRSMDNDPIGGTGLFEVAVEARIKAFGDFSIVPFVDAGNVYPSSLPSFSDIGDLRVGAGVGVRYATNFGPIRVDVGTPLNPRQGDGRIAVYVSLGQAF
jgi:translocation and assembly module TamA